MVIPSNTHTLPVCSAWACNAFWLVNSLLGIPALLACQHTPPRGWGDSEAVSDVDCALMCGRFTYKLTWPRPAIIHRRKLLGRPLRPPSLTLASKHLAVGRKLPLQDRLREQQRPPHARARAHIHKLVLIWRKQVLTRDERGRENPLTLGVGPHINEPLLLGVVEQRLLARELPWQHRPSAALLEPSLPRHWAVLRTYPLRPLNALRLTLPPRPISCRERSICHEHARPQQQARQD